MRRREFFGAASDCRSVLDLDLDILADLAGAGAIGATTGMAAGHSSITMSSLRTAESLATAALTMATHFTEARAFMRSQGGTRAGSAALIMAEMLTAFLRAGTPALEAVASTAVVRMVAAGGTKDRSAAFS